MLRRAARGRSDAAHEGTAARADAGPVQRGQRVERRRPLTASGSPWMPTPRSRVSRAPARRAPLRGHPGAAQGRTTLPTPLIISWYLPECGSNSTAVRASARRPPPGARRCPGRDRHPSCPSPASRGRDSRRRPISSPSVVAGPGGRGVTRTVDWAGRERGYGRRPHVAEGTAKAGGARPPGGLTWRPAMAPGPRSTRWRRAGPRRPGGRTGRSRSP
jgi:hypothetical protein